MADYLWKYSGFGPRVGVTKEKKDSIFLRDKSRPFKAWWNGCGISEGTKTLEESKRIALEYARGHAIDETQKALKTIQDAAISINEIDKLLGSGNGSR